MKSELENIEINTPRDRNGKFEPTIIPKHERNINGLEENNTRTLFMMNENKRYL